MPTISAWCIRNSVLNLFKKQTIQNNNQTICEKAKEELQIHNVQPEIFVKRSEEAESCDKVIPGWKLVREDGERVEVTLNTTSPSIVALAEKYRVSSKRLLEAIKYQVGIQEFKPPTREQIEQSEPNYPADDFVAVASEFNLPIWLIRHAVKTEQYSGGHGSYDSALQRARTEAVG